MKYAAIDVGTNTILLLIVEKTRSVRDVVDISTITRLGEGLREMGCLSEGAMGRSLRTLERYRAIVDEQKVDKVALVGTAALREAANSDRFLNLVERRTGFRIRIISGRDEAYYTYLSVNGDEIIPGQRLLILDIGGGSTEIIEGDRKEFRDFVSLPVGTVKLTELFVRHDPPTVDDLTRLRQHVRDLLSLSFQAHASPVTLVGTGGTITTLAAMAQELPEYAKKKIHGYWMTAPELDRLIEVMKSMTTSERCCMRGMEQGREDIILQGAILLQEIMARFKICSLVVSAKGVRYGVVSVALEPEICEDHGAGHDDGE
jgi:exopolyphosphatase / guanosine-5'-triphosphate,3'-diphosphate pyrophosphatase